MYIYIYIQYVSFVSISSKSVNWASTLAVTCATFDGRTVNSATRLAILLFSLPAFTGLGSKRVGCVRARSWVSGRRLKPPLNAHHWKPKRNGFRTTHQARGGTWLHHEFEVTANYREALAPTWAVLIKPPKSTPKYSLRLRQIEKKTVKRFTFIRLPVNFFVHFIFLAHLYSYNVCWYLFLENALY